MNDEHNMGTPMNILTWSMLKKMSTSLHFSVEFFPRKLKKKQGIIIRVWSMRLLKKEVGRMRIIMLAFDAPLTRSVIWSMEITSTIMKIFDILLSSVIVVSMSCKRLLEAWKKWIMCFFNPEDILDSRYNAFLFASLCDSLWIPITYICSSLDVT